MPRPRRTDGKPPQSNKAQVNNPRTIKVPATGADGLPHGGRPAVHVDEVQLYELATTHASYEHMARILGIGAQTLWASEKYREIVNKARAVKKQELLAAQFSAAITGRNPTMMIWLGKQYLGQKDVQRSEISGPNGKPQQIEVGAAKAVAYFPDNGRTKRLPSATVTAVDGVPTAEKVEVEEVLPDKPWLRDDPST